MNFFKLFSKRVVGIIVAMMCLSQVPLSSQTVTQIRVLDSSGRLSAFEIGGERVSIDQLNSSPQKFSGTEAFKTEAKLGNILGVRTLQYESRLTFEAFTNLTLSVPAQHEVSISGDFEKQTLTLQASLANAKSLSLSLPDGAAVQFGPSSKIHFDFFKDGSYTLRGDGKVEAVSAEGQKFTLTAHHPPLTGGPLIQVGEKGNLRMQRLNPTTQLKIYGSTPEDMIFQIGDERRNLSEYQGRAIEMPNGSKIEFQSGSLKWKVVKGDFRFLIPGISGWRGFGFTGQSGSITWDVSSKAVDIKNLSPDESILVGCPSQTFAVLEPNTILQFSQMNSSTYSASGVNGKVILYNINSGQEANLKLGNFLVRSGNFEGGGKGATLRNNLSLTWGKGLPLQVTGSLGRFVVGVNKEDNLRGSNSGELSVRYSSSGEVILKAVAGEFMLSILQIKNMVVDLKEGDTLTIHFDHGRGNLLVKADPDNSSPIRFDTPEKVVLILYANDQATLIGEQIEGYAVNESTMIFYENAGAGEMKSFAFSQTTPRFLNINVLNRVSQPPISIIR